MWDYAELSKEAKVNGGPESLLENIRNEVRNEESNKGRIERRQENISYLVVGLGLGVAMLYGAQWVIDKIKERKETKKRMDSELVRNELQKISDDRIL